ncbi:MAG: ribosome biogenesis GTPase Der [Alphaproteobacteria bacterium]
MPFTIAIAGRPNVGKSTLFNRLVGKRLALVDDVPGVTRDRREGAAQLADLHFNVFDTAGLETAEPGSLAGRMTAQTERALGDADAVMFVIDARAGITTDDEIFAETIRKCGRPVILVANKCEGAAGMPGMLEAYKLGLGDPVPISAEHGDGITDLYDAIVGSSKDRSVFDAEFQNTVDFSIRTPDDGTDDDEDDLQTPIPSLPIQLAIVGRPNVGKSTLINRLIGEERLLTGPEAGITRDSIAIDWQWKGRDIRLSDTAGLRKKARISRKVERLSAADSMRTIRFAQVVVLVLDANDMLEKQDLTIARQVVEEGRALLIAANKWDAVEDKPKQLQLLRDRIEKSLPQARGIPVVTVSALRGDKLDRLLDAVLRTFDTWNKRVSTSKLNNWLAGITAEHPPPLAKGRRVKLRYMTQAKTRPPTFVVFTSIPEALPDSYMRYLSNRLREDFDLPGIPIRLHMRKGKNPYAPEDKKPRGKTR